MSSPNEEPANVPEPGPEPLYPNISDVLKTRHVLRWKIREEGLPMEIVDMIIDAAEYWPSTEVRLGKRVVIRQDRDQELVRTVPLCFDEESLKSTNPKPLPHRQTHPCRKIVFSISAHDQGWGGTPQPSKFGGSYTWFDTEIIHNAHEIPREPQDTAEKPPEQARHFEPSDPFLLPSVHKLQSNARAQREEQHYTIVWHHLDNIRADSSEAEEIENSQGRGRATLDGSKVRDLEVGDSVAVWGRARFGGWSNFVIRLNVRVFWVV
ncbi:hypothetical protein PHISCL_06239 [Aspergillus sclerotialis]|uniref:Uncharacterized protein n=1 Tax=Aspergillus sclerotialis TaxID=2070753 RepID=A0A3A2ZE33_9EURO|nr:hypothetical protein PHISCL_06239 [Aspergillus sclerotialis]